MWYVCVHTLLSILSNILNFWPFHQHTVSCYDAWSPPYIQRNLITEGCCKLMWVAITFCRRVVYIRGRRRQQRRSHLYAWGTGVYQKGKIIKHVDEDRGLLHVYTLYTRCLQIYSTLIIWKYILCIRVDIQIHCCRGRKVRKHSAYWTWNFLPLNWKMYFKEMFISLPATTR